jgi:hypothetical protein
VPTLVPLSPLVSTLRFATYLPQLMLDSRCIHVPPQIGERREGLVLSRQLAGGMFSP